LVDADVVEHHNLNRQQFVAEDVGIKKVLAMKKRLLAINRDAEINECDCWLDKGNVAGFVSAHDLMFDTIDVLDLSAIIALNDECRRQSKWSIGAVSAGWGALTICFSPNSQVGYRELLGIPPESIVENMSYMDRFSTAFARLGAVFPKEIIDVMSKTLVIMEDGAPCPAPHLAIGSYCIAALATTVALRILDEKPVVVAPQACFIDLNHCALHSVISLL
jgi:molybdopterin/thiamine biosynthesis adenylyltransferase